MGKFMGRIGNAFDGMDKGPNQAERVFGDLGGTDTPIVQKSPVRIPLEANINQVTASQNLGEAVNRIGSVDLGNPDGSRIESILSNIHYHEEKGIRSTLVFTTPSTESTSIIISSTPLTAKPNLATRIQQEATKYLDRASNTISDVITYLKRRSTTYVDNAMGYLGSHLTIQHIDYTSLKDNGVKSLYVRQRKRNKIKNKGPQRIYFQVAGKLQQLYNTAFDEDGYAKMTAREAVEKLKKNEISISISSAYRYLKQIREIMTPIYGKESENLRFSHKR